MVPSAGCLFPIETYLVINNVKNLALGIYHYKVKEHALQKLKEGKNCPFPLPSAALSQDLIADVEQRSSGQQLFREPKKSTASDFIDISI